MRPTAPQTRPVSAGRLTSQKLAAAARSTAAGAAAAEPAVSSARGTMRLRTGDRVPIRPTAAAPAAAPAPVLAADAILQVVPTLALVDAFQRQGDIVTEWAVADSLWRRCSEFVSVDDETLAAAMPPAATAGPSPPDDTGDDHVPLRWLAEQEFVIAAVLAARLPSAATVLREKAEHLYRRGANAATPASSKSPARATGGSDEAPSPKKEELPRAVEQVLGPDAHPIAVVAAYSMLAFPHWGDVASFATHWQTQARLLTAVPNPAAQREFPIANKEGTVFRSTMECGNLARVEAKEVQGTVIYLLWTEGDVGTDKRSWFRFAVKNFSTSQAMCFRIMNLSPNVRLYRNGMKPVWMCAPTSPSWRQVGEVSFVIPADDGCGQLSFYVLPPAGCKEGDEMHVSFTVPYGYCDLLRHITVWHHLVRSSTSNIRFEERVLCRSQDGRKLHLLIVTSQQELRPARNPRVNTGIGGAASGASSPFASFDQGKRVVLISGRVHPGEVSASHGLHGLITFLLSSDKRAAQLRQHFLFFIVPMLNPDGVARGHTRLDQRGLNLNRCYNSPSATEQPTVHALKKVFENLQSTFGDRMTLYLDFHSHASQRKAFVFGNFLPTTAQTWNMAYAKLLECHSKGLFDFAGCKFARTDMSAKDGTSRVLFGAGIVNSYTVEVAHFTTDGKIVEPYTWFRQAHRPGATASPSKVAETRGNPRPSPDESLQGSAPLLPRLLAPGRCEIIDEAATVGQACLLALLDLCNLQSSASVSAAGGLEGVVRSSRAAAIALATKKK